MRSKDLREQVAIWEAERDRLGKLIGPAQALLKAMDESNTSTPKQPRQPRSTMSPAERWDRIKGQLVMAAGPMSAKELAQELHSTSGTIRNDIMGHDSELIRSGTGSPKDPFRYKLREIAHIN